MLRVKAYAKINLGLAVLGKRADGFHNIRTIFQTISLADEILLSWTAGRGQLVEVACSVDIPSPNIAELAGRAILGSTRASGKLRIEIRKRIPIGGGLGGGSTDAAAVLLAAPKLIGRHVPFDKLSAIAAELGSDVPFFLHGGCVLGMGRGEELYPLPDFAPARGLLIAPAARVSTPRAYDALARPVSELTSVDQFPILKKLQSLAWALDVRAPRDAWSGDCVNDFEEVVFRQYPVLKKLRRKLSRAGAAPAIMTGSGAALFGIFPDSSAVQAAMGKLRASTVGGHGVLPFSFISRSAYRSRWKRWLRDFDRQNAIRPA